MSGNGSVDDAVDAELRLRRKDFEDIAQALAPLVANLGFGAATAELLATQIKPQLEAIYERYRPTVV